mmetsp:Transcript_62760/g.163076  ORF Transcript_62760/g.163076 Transcript_62760/m.163076 type:complete len:200 (-) Transcript_62760:1294-1893(-)
MFSHHFCCPAHSPGYCDAPKRLSSASGSVTGSRPPGLAPPTSRSATAGPSSPPGAKSSSAASASAIHSVVTAPGAIASTTTFSAPFFLAPAISQSTSGSVRLSRSQPSAANAMAQTTATEAPFASAASPLEATWVPWPSTASFSASWREVSFVCMSSRLDLSFVVPSAHLPRSAIFAAPLAMGSVPPSFFSRTAPLMIV